ncbi:MAG: hypothetical protein QXU00_05610 [Ignisphaera sp.]
MHIVKSLQDYLSVLNRFRRIVVIGESCVDCHVFLKRYSRCLEDFEIVLLPVNIDDDLLNFFFSNGILGIPIVVIDGKHFWGDINHLGEVVCSSQ